MHHRPGGSWEEDARGSGCSFPTPQLIFGGNQHYKAANFWLTPAVQIIKVIFTY